MDALNWPKVSAKSFHEYILMNAVLLNFMFIKKNLKSITVSTKKLNGTTVCDINNNLKCFLFCL